MQHGTTASLDTEVIVCSTRTASACPTEFVAAELASHVVAACVFLDSCPTYWTHHHIVFVIFGPPLKLLVHQSFTAQPTMPLLFTLKADPGLALAALKLSSL